MPGFAMAALRPWTGLALVARRLSHLALTVELVFDHVEKKTMQPLDQAQSLEIFGAEGFVLCWRFLARQVQCNTHDPASYLF